MRVLLRNPVWRTATICTMCEQSIVVGFVAYIGKYMQVTFGLELTLATRITGTSAAPLAAAPSPLLSVSPPRPGPAPAPPLPLFAALPLALQQSAFSAAQFFSARPVLCCTQDYVFPFTIHYSRPAMFFAQLDARTKID